MKVQNIDDLHSLKGIDRILAEIELHKEIKTAKQERKKAYKQSQNQDYKTKKRMMKNGNADKTA